MQLILDPISLDSPPRVVVDVPKEYRHLYARAGKVVVYPAQVLRSMCDEVTRFGPKLRNITNDMMHLLLNGRGVGLAAPQVGIGKRIVVVRTPSMKTVMVNPKIVGRSGTTNTEEGCLSLPGLYGVVPRSELVEVEYQNVSGDMRRESLGRLESVVLQHEIDHLNGVLFVDRAEIGSLYWQQPK